MKLTDRRGALNPTILSRAGEFITSGRFRSVRVRRLIALALVIVAIAMIALSQRGPTSTQLVVAASDLRPGTVLTGNDVAAKTVPGFPPPAGAFTSVNQIVGQRVTGPIRRGEILTDSRMLTSHLPRSLTGNPDARLVPVRPADESVVQLVRQGDLVDVVDAESAVLARGAVVAVAPSIQAGRTTNSAAVPILLAMSRQSAQMVAAAGLGTALAIILH